jgi:hypothetical protein
MTMIEQVATALQDVLTWTAQQLGCKIRRGSGPRSGIKLDQARDAVV